MARRAEGGDESMALEKGAAGQLDAATGQRACCAVLCISNGWPIMGVDGVCLSDGGVKAEMMCVEFVEKPGEQSPRCPPHA